MSGGFDPEDLTKHFHKPASVEERIFDRVDQLNNFQFSHASKLDLIAANTNRTANWTQGVANQLSQIRGLLSVVIILLAVIAWKLVLG